MAGTLLPPYSSKTLKDNTFYESKTMPVAANTVNFTAFNLLKAAPFPVGSEVVLKITVPSTDMNGKNANFRIMDSADDSSFANVSAIGNPCLVVATNTAGTVSLVLPPTIKRYVQVTCLGEANGTANRNNAVVELLF